MQSAENNQRLLLTPVLEEYDNGLFECYVDDYFRGGLQMKTVTVWESVFTGFNNYLIGMAFSFPMFIFAAAYRIFGPGLSALGIAGELFNREQNDVLNMNFDEMMLNLQKVEQTWINLLQVVFVFI